MTSIMFRFAIALHVLLLEASDHRWELVEALAMPVIGETESKPYGIGGYETGNFVKIDGTYHALINELPNAMPWSRCPQLYWDASTQLGHWTSNDSLSGPWVRRATIRDTPAAKYCNFHFQNRSHCKLNEMPPDTWNSGGLHFGVNSVNGSAPVWNLFYGDRWAVSMTGGRDGIFGPWLDIACVPWFAGLAPAYQLRNGSWRGWWSVDLPQHTTSNCTWPCHSLRMFGLAGTDADVIGEGSWSKISTGAASNFLPFLWNEPAPNAENPIVISSFDEKEFIMVYDANAQNATCRDDPSCSWVGGQCWSDRDCNSIGIAWSEDGTHWQKSQHLQVQLDHQCGLIRTPLGLIPEPERCKGCYSVLFTGWVAPQNVTDGTDKHRRLGHAWHPKDCPKNNKRCQAYAGFKPVCAALIRNMREADGDIDLVV